MIQKLIDALGGHQDFVHLCVQAVILTVQQLGTQSSFHLIQPADWPGNLSSSTLFLLPK